MNEHDAWQNLRPKLNTFGVATRLENAAAASVPDILYLTGGLMMFIELKVNYSGRIYFNHFQLGYGVRISHHIKPHNHWVFIWDDAVEGFRAYTFKDIRSMPMETVNDRISIVWEFDRFFALKQMDTYKEWLDHVNKLEFE